VLKTRFTELVGCDVPLQMAPIERWPLLTVAIANAGGLGMARVSELAPRQIETFFDDMRKQTSGVFGGGFLPPAPTDDWALVEDRVAAAAARVKVVDCFYFDPNARLIEIVHAAGTLASWQVGSLDEARAAVDAGCDFIIAQGIAAGGHVRGHIGLLALLSQVLEVVNIPVLAAGGIGTARTMAAVLAAGADGVRVGTRFLAAQEADTHPEYLKALIAAEAADTLYTDIFSVGWPDAPHRVLRKSAEGALAFQGDFIGEWHEPNGERIPIPHLQPFVPSNSVTGTISAMPFWAGESVDGIKGVQPAAEIIHELVDGAEQLLRRW
jgi:nitronate monooxygenase